MFARSLQSPRRPCSSSVYPSAAFSSKFAARLRILLFIPAFTLTAHAFQDASPPPVEAIIASARSAVGSEARLAAVRSISATADCIGPKGKYTTRTDSFRENKTRFHQTFTYKPEVVDVKVNGEAVWERRDREDVFLSPFQRMAARAHEYQKMSYDVRSFFHDLELAGAEPFEGRLSIKIESKNELGMDADLFFDKETKRFNGYVLKLPNSDETIRNVFLEWRNVQGLTVPTVVRATDNQGNWTLRFHTIELNRAPAELLNIPPRIADMAELLRLHDQQATAHLTYNAELFIEMFAERLTQLQRGNSVIRTKAENVARFKTYFAGFKFSEWRDIKPPVIKISKDGTLAAKVVEKSVKGIYKNTDGTDGTDHTIFAWLEVWEKIGGKWKVITVASTEKSGDK